MRFRFWVGLCLTVCFCSTAQGQHSRPDAITVGAMVGTLNGLSLRAAFHNADRPDIKNSIAIHLSTNADNFALASFHIRKERDVANSPVHSILGAGLHVGAKSTTLFWGPSVVLGIRFEKGPYEIFLVTLPRMDVMPSWSGRFDSATGLRFRL